MVLPLQGFAIDSWNQVVGNGVLPLGDGFGAGGATNGGNKCVDALTRYKGFLYAAVGQDGTGSGNLPSVWRTSDLVTWTNVAVSGFAGNDLCIESDTNGIYLASGFNATFNQGMVWRSTNGLQWQFFFGTGSGYNLTNNFTEVLGLQGGSLYSATANQKGGQVWKRPTDGSAVWAKVLDFGSGFGTADGPQTNLSSACLYCPPSATNVMFYGTQGATNCALYESSDGGASWQRNAAAGNAFGTNNGKISAIVEFNGFLYAGTTNAQGGSLWRTPLTNAIAWSSTLPWEQVVGGGFGPGSNGELHCLVAAYGRLWVCLRGSRAQVWRSGDGANWVQSNRSGFAPNNAYGGYQALAAFTNAAGNPFMVWAGSSANPTNLDLQAAQVWATQIAPAGSPSITVDPQSVSTNIGASVSFNVTATGVEPLNYQWRLNAANIVGATNAALVLGNVQNGDAGGYDVIVSNAIGTVTSQVAALSVALVIETSALPTAGTVGAAYSQALSAACGAPPYTWALIGGALPDGLALNSVGQISGAPGTAGIFNFTVQVTDAVGQAVRAAFRFAIADPWVHVVGNSSVPLGDGFGFGGVLNTNNAGIQSLNGYNGFLYAAVSTVSNRATVWRSSDMLNWTNIPINFPIDFHNVFDMQSNSNGIFFGTGYGMFPSAAQVWKSTNGVNWFVFSGYGSGFGETNFNVMVSLQGNVLYATIGANITNGSAEVWRRPADGSANWTEVLDFNTGLGSADGILPNLGSSFIYAPPGATNAVFLPCNDGAGSCWLYESADGGATWHKNTAAASNFGDANNGYIASMMEFNGYLYAGTGNSAGAQIWRTPLAVATNWSSTNAWQQVVGDGFGYMGTEFHRFAVAGGQLWTFLFAHADVKAGVWRSADGTNWVQSNVDSFGTGGVVCNGALGSFASADGNTYMVWGGTWGSPTSAIAAAQVWATQIGAASAPAVANPMQSVTTYSGSLVSFSADANGAPPLAYQWRLNATSIVGATNATLVLYTVRTNEAGVYDVIVSNAGGCVTSRVATLSVLASATGLDGWGKVVGNGVMPLGDGFGAGGANVPDNQAVEWLQVFNGQIYAAVGQQESGSGNPASIWRSSDLTNWTRVGAGAFIANDTDIYSIASDGTRLFAGTKATSGGANIYVSTNGSDWSLFNSASSGFSRNTTVWASHLGVLNGHLFAGILTTNGSGQVRKCPTVGSPSWTKVVDFYTGLGLPNKQAVPGINAMYFYAVSNTLFMPAGMFLYQSTDAAGTNWVKNAQAGAGFGDTNTLNLSSLVDFGGFLYAPTHNVSGGGQLWRTPLANALANGPLPWTKVVDNGFGQGARFSELHHISVGLGCLWVSVQGPVAQVWRSMDGTTWIQSNTDGFDTNNPATSYKPVVETFNNTVVWGGASGTNATGAQVWETALRQYTLAVNSAYGGALPGALTANSGSILNEWVTNADVAYGTTQYVCTGRTVVGNAFTSVSATNVTLMLTNNAVLTWLWATNFWLATAAGSNGSVNVASGWQAMGVATAITATAAQYSHFTNWTGSFASSANPLSLTMSGPVAVTASFDANMTSSAPVPVPYWWLAQYGWTNDFESVVLNAAHGNGMSYWAAYVAGADPDDPASAFSVSSLTMRPGTQGIVTWPSVAGRAYGLDCAANLLDGFVSVPGATNLPATPPVNAYTNASGMMVSSVFYRVRVWLAP